MKLKYESPEADLEELVGAADQNLLVDTAPAAIC